MLIQLITHPMLLPVTLPLLAGLVCLLIPRFADNLRSGLAVLSALLVIGFVWTLFEAAGTTYDPFVWLSLRVDALSAFILLAVAFFGLIVAIYSVGYMKGRARHREYFTYLLWTLGASCGVCSLSVAPLTLSTMNRSTNSSRREPMSMTFDASSA